MNPRVKKVLPLPEHKLRLVFDNGEVGTYDCTPWLDFGVFRELADETYFRRVRAFNGTVMWPHEQDICPDTLYMDSVREHRRNRAPSLERRTTCPRILPADSADRLGKVERGALAVREECGKYTVRQRRKQRKA